MIFFGVSIKKSEKKTCYLVNFRIFAQEHQKAIPLDHAVFHGLFVFPISGSFRPTAHWDKTAYQANCYRLNLFLK